MIFYQIAKNTLRESLREPIYYLLLITALLIIAFSPMMALFVFRDQSKLVFDTGLATTLVFGMVCSILCASHTVTREMKNGTVLLLLSKPVPKYIFISAKIAGVILAMTIFVFCCEAAMLITIRVAKDQFDLDWLLFYSYLGLLLASSIFGALRNYLQRKPFASSSVSALFLLSTILAIIVCIKYPGSTAIDEPVIALSITTPVFVILMFAIWIMSALTVSLSTRIDIVSNLTIVSVIFFLGLVSDYFFASSAGTFSLSALFYAILPNWQLFWLADAVAARRNIPFDYIFLTGIYAISYIFFLAYIAVIYLEGKRVALRPG